MTKIICLYIYTKSLFIPSDRKSSERKYSFMWLGTRQTPDFRTINRFRLERMKSIIDEVFTSVLQLLIDEGFISLKHYFLDGTQIEANANRYTDVFTYLRKGT